MSEILHEDLSTCVKTLATNIAIDLWLPRLPIVLWFVWLRQHVRSVPFSGLYTCSLKYTQSVIIIIIIIIIITVINMPFVTISVSGFVILCK